MNGRNNKKRIVLSDDEDDFQDTDLGDTASAQKLTESIHHLKMSDSATKPVRQSIRKRLFSDDENELNGSISNSRKESSKRSQVLSSKKETQRAKAAAEMHRFRANGLNAINFDSDEEYESEGDNEDEEDDDIAQFIVDDEDDEEEDKATRKSSKGESKSTSIVSAPKKASKSSSSSRKHYSSSHPSSSLTARTIPSTDARKAFSEYRGGRDEEEERYASDLDDFIVADDYDENEQAEAESSGESDTELGASSNNQIVIDDDDDDDDNSVEIMNNHPKANVAHTKSPPSKPNKSKSNSHRKVIIALSDDEEKEEDAAPNVSKSTLKRRVRRTLFTASDDDNDDSDGENHTEEEDGDDEANDGPLLYWKLNAQMDEAASGGEDYDDMALAGQLFSLNQKFTLEEAFAKYLELLGKTLISPRFRKQLQDRTLPRMHLNTYEKAARQIENLVCTHRESLLGSSAWQGDFLDELAHRPFYMCPQSTVSACSGDGEGRCAACGRTAKEAFFSVYLHGPRYEGMGIWSQNKWIQSLPTCMFLHPTGAEDDSDNDDADEPQRQRGSRVSGKKRSRTYVSYEDDVEAAEQGQTIDEAENEEDDEAIGDAYRHRHKRNKQFAAFQQHSGSNTALSSAFKTPATIAHVTDASTKKKRSRSESESTDHVDPQDGEEDGVVFKSSNKKRRVVILSESEHESDCDQRKSANRVAAAPATNNRKQTPGKMVVGEDEEADGEDASGAQKNRSPSKWWNKSLPRALNQESESRWELSIHCKNRTNLYHTLLHYKFRLILKLRENIEKMHQRETDSEYAGYALEDLPVHYLQRLLKDLLQPERKSRSFVAQETDRLQVLLRTAEKRYGGDKYETATDIWGTETLPLNSKVSTTSSSSSSSMTHSANTMRQLKLIKKDFSAGVGGSMVMGEPRRSTFQARISSWLTPKN